MIDAERAVIGGLLTRQCWDDVAFLRESDFQDKACREIFATIRAMTQADALIDIITVGERMGRDWILDLDEIASRTVGTGAERHARIVREHSLRRQSSAVHRAAADQYMQDTSSPFDTIHASTMGMLEQIAGSGVTESESAAEIADRAADEMAESRAATANGEFLGVTCGLGGLNLATNGLMRKTLTILAGRPGAGKTALSLEYVLRNPCGVISLEMDSTRLLQRLAANTSSVPLWHLLKGRNPEALGLVSELPIWMNDRSYDIGSICAQITRWKREQGITLAVVDHIGLIEGGDGDNRNLQLGHITRELKKLSKRLDLAVLALCQVNRGVEHRADKRLNLGDLRESGHIEEDADMVIGLSVPDMERTPRPVDIDILKSRNGVVGAVPGQFLFNGALQRYSEAR